MLKRIISSVIAVLMLFSGVLTITACVPAKNRTVYNQAGGFYEKKAKGVIEVEYLSNNYNYPYIITIAYEKELTFEFSTTYGYMVCSEKHQTGKFLQLSSGDSFIWGYRQSGYIEDIEGEIVYIDIVAKNEEKIVGYGVVKIFNEGEPEEKIEVVKFAFIPQIDEEDQIVSEEQIKLATNALKPFDGPLPVYNEDVIGIHTLREGYKLGCFSVQDLEEIAYLVNNNLAYPEPLDEDIAAKIKQTAVDVKYTKGNPSGKPRAEDYRIKTYLGNYNGSYVVVIDDPYVDVIGQLYITVLEIGGVRFTHSGNLGYVISFWRDGYVPEKRPTDENGLVYTLNDEGTAYSVSDYIGSEGIVNVPLTFEGLPVTEIATNAFDRCAHLTDITIPASVTSIGKNAFCSCVNLKSVTLSEGLKIIGYSAFISCTSLRNFVIPDGVTSIGSFAFSGCSSLTDISIPDGVTSIGSYAFSSCSSLTDISIPESVKSIGSCAFSGCVKLAAIILPSGITSIEHSTFFKCSSLTHVTIPEGVDTIGVSTFRDCSSLTSITIPKSVTNIEDSAFEGCSKLSSVFYASTAKDWAKINIGDSNNKLIGAQRFYTET